MNIKEISRIANGLGIKPIARLKKAELIHFIQHTEGNFACFNTALKGECDRHGCTWRTDCLKSSPKNLH
jgi:hypothetical protein